MHRNGIDTFVVNRTAILVLSRSLTRRATKISRKVYVGKQQ